MVIATVHFQSGAEFTKYLEKTIGEIKNTLGDYLKEVEEVRERYDKARKSYDVVKKMMKGKKEGGGDSIIGTKQLEVAGFRVLMNPSAEYELSLMESVITSVQERLEAFERAKELLPLLSSQVGTKLTMVLDDGIPTGFMVYLKTT